MGIRFYCPNGHKLNVKEFQAGRRAVCPYCGVKLRIPFQSTRKSSRADRDEEATELAAVAGESMPTEPPAPAEAPSPMAEPAAAQPMPARPMPVQAAVPQPAPVQPAPTKPIPMAASPAQPSTPYQSGMPPLAAPVAPGPSGPASPDTAAPGWGYPAPASSDPYAGGAAWQGADPLGDATRAAPPPAPVADPLTESPHMVWYVRPPSGGQFGPAMADVMRTWITEGRVSADSLVWREGWRDWQEAGVVFPQLRVGPAGPAMRQAPANLEPIMPSAYPLHHLATHRPSKSNQFVIVSLLVAAVLTLIAIFFWVLYNKP